MQRKAFQNNTKTRHHQSNKGVKETFSDEVESLPRKLHVDIPSQVRLEVTTHL